MSVVVSFSMMACHRCGDLFTLTALDSTEFLQMISCTVPIFSQLPLCMPLVLLLLLLCVFICLACCVILMALLVVHNNVSSSRSCVLLGSQWLVVVLVVLLLSLYVMRLLVSMLPLFAFISCPSGKKELYPARFPRKYS